MTPKQIREALGLSQEWVASRLGLTERQVRYKEVKNNQEYREFLYSCYKEILDGAKEYPESALQAQEVRQHLTDIYMKRWFESP